MDPETSRQTFSTTDSSRAEVLLLDAETRAAARLSFMALALLGGASMLGVALSPYLVTHYPLLLIALSPVGRHLVLVAPSVDPFAFVAVTLVRRMLFYLASFHLGRALGPWAIPWIEARAMRFGRFVRFVEQLFARAPRLVVLLLAGPTVSALAGVSGMGRGLFVMLATPSLVVRPLLVLGFASWLRADLEIVLAWIDRYSIPATLVMAGLVALYWWRKRTPLASVGD